MAKGRDGHWKPSLPSLSTALDNNKFHNSCLHPAVLWVQSFKHRLMAMAADPWMLSQLSSILLYPQAFINSVCLCKKTARRWHYLLRKSNCTIRLWIFRQGCKKLNLLGPCAVLFLVDSAGYTLQKLVCNFLCCKFHTDLWGLSYDNVFGGIVSDHFSPPENSQSKEIGNKSFFEGENHTMRGVILCLYINQCCYEYI